MEKRNAFRRTMRVKCLSVILVMIFFIGLAKGNTLSIDPAFQFANGSGTINITLSPSEPIKGWELRIIFSPFKIRINNISEGNFFQGYPTFFTPNMIIDNINGTVTKLYGLILGQGNVSTKGTLLQINFTALNTTGISPITISGEGIANETQYLDLTTHDGEVQVYSQFTPWDINKDGTANMLDASLLVMHYGEKCGYSDPWDVKIDGSVNLYDISVFVNRYGG